MALLVWLPLVARANLRVGADDTIAVGISKSRIPGGFDVWKAGLSCDCRAGYFTLRGRMLCYVLHNRESLLP